MSMVKHLGLSIVIALLALCALDIGGKLPIPGMDRLVSTAQARVGRPLTVTGVARRTTRRCAAVVYAC